MPSLSFHPLSFTVSFTLIYSIQVKRSSCCKWNIPNLPNCFSAHLGTRVLKPSIAAVPRSPISSSVPQAGRNITRTRVPPQTPRISGRPFTPSKTSSSHSSSTPGGNGVLTSPFFFPSSQVATSGYLLLSAPSYTLLCNYAFTK